MFFKKIKNPQNGYCFQNPKQDSTFCPIKNPKFEPQMLSTKSFSIFRQHWNHHPNPSHLRPSPNHLLLPLSLLVRDHQILFNFHMGIGAITQLLATSSRCLTTTSLFSSLLIVERPSANVLYRVRKLKTLKDLDFGGKFVSEYPEQDGPGQANQDPFLSYPATKSLNSVLLSSNNVQGAQLKIRIRRVLYNYYQNILFLNI